MRGSKHKQATFGLHFLPISARICADPSVPTLICNECDFCLRENPRSRCWIHVVRDSSGQTLAQRVLASTDILPPCELSIAPYFSGGRSPPLQARSTVGPRRPCRRSQYFNPLRYRVLSRHCSQKRAVRLHSLYVPQEDVEREYNSQLF